MGSGADCSLKRRGVLALGLALLAGCAPAGDKFAGPSAPAAEALVGTFLGVFLAYGMVGPMANRMGAVIDEDAAFYKIIQAVLVAHLHGNAAQISVEIGRGSVPSGAQPSFLELEEALNAIPTDAG